MPIVPVYQPTNQHLRAPNAINATIMTTDFPVSIFSTKDPDTDQRTIGIKQRIWYLRL